MRVGAMLRHVLGLFLAAVVTTSTAVTWTDAYAANSGVGTATGNVLDLASAAAQVRGFIQARKDQQNHMTNRQDIWKMELDHNTLLQNERRNLQYANLAMSNANMYYEELKYRLLTRNNQLYAENNAYNASVQFNEQMIKFVNQTNVWLDTHSEALDAQNIELMAEIGVLRDGHTDAAGRHFGLFRQQQNSVQRKLIEKANWDAVEALALAERAQKETEIYHVTILRGYKANAMVNNTSLEPHVATLTAQRNYQQTRKLIETHKKKNNQVRHDNYAAQVPALLASQLALEAELRKLVIENDRLREIQREREEERLDLKKDRDLQKWNFVEALLQKNKFLTYASSMKSQYETTLAERDTIQTENAAKQVSQSNSYIELTDCEENNRWIEQHKLVLKQRNSMLCANCWHRHATCDQAP